MPGSARPWSPARSTRTHRAELGTAPAPKGQGGAIPYPGWHTREVGMLGMILPWHRARGILSSVLGTQRAPGQGKLLEPGDRAELGTATDGPALPETAPATRLPPP